MNSPSLQQLVIYSRIPRQLPNSHAEANTFKYGLHWKFRGLTAGLLDKSLL
jgi:hypothetical protein